MRAFDLYTVLVLDSFNQFVGLRKKEIGIQREHPQVPDSSCGDVDQHDSIASKTRRYSHAGTESLARPLQELLRRGLFGLILPKFNLPQQVFHRVSLHLIFALASVHPVSMRTVRFTVIALVRTTAPQTALREKAARNKNPLPARLPVAGCRNPNCAYSYVGRITHPRQQWFSQQQAHSRQLLARVEASMSKCYLQPATPVMSDAGGAEKIQLAAIFLALFASMRLTTVWEELGHLAAQLTSRWHWVSPRIRVRRIEGISPEIARR
jgi:hypothetical protein